MAERTEQGVLSPRELAAVVAIAAADAPLDSQGDALQEASQILNRAVLPQVRSEIKITLSYGVDPWGRAMKGLSKEAMVMVLGRGVEISDPSRAACTALDSVRKLGGDSALNTLLYLPGADLSQRLPSGFLYPEYSFHFLVRNQTPLADLMVKPGWRLVDLRMCPNNPLGKFPDNVFYADDIELTAHSTVRVFNRAESSSHRPEMWTGTGEEHYSLDPCSRLGLDFDEVVDQVVPSLEERAGLPKGTLRLPTLAEAVLLYNLYQVPQPSAVSEWVTNQREDDRFVCGIREWADGTRSIRARAFPYFASSRLIGFRLQGNF